MTSAADAVTKIFASTEMPVWAVTASWEKQRGGLLATFVNRATLVPDRTLMLAVLSASHFTASLIAASKAFALHLLDAPQAPLAFHLALTSGHDTDKLAAVPYSTKRSGSPVLANSLSWLDCQVVKEERVGDRIYFWGEVLAAEQLRSGSPLTDRQLLELATPEQRAQLKTAYELSIIEQRPQVEEWLERVRMRKG